MKDEEDDRLRARLQEALVSAGVNHGRVALEVLFWMPAEFLREYQELYMRALHMGDGDDTQRAGEDEGQIKKKVKADQGGGLRTRARSKGREDEGLGGTTRGARPGKRYKREWVVKDEQALEVKTRVDRALRGLIAREKGRVGLDESRGHGSRGGGQTHGSTPGDGRGLVDMGKGRKRCEGCGLIAASDWVICPRPHS